MIGFLTVAVIMSVVAVVWLFFPARGNQAAQKNGSSEKSNLAILRDQLNELEADFARGVIGEKERDEARAELNRRAIEEANHTEKSDSVKPCVSAESQTTPKNRARGIVRAVTVFLTIALASGLLYMAIGTPGAFDALLSAGGQTGAHQTSEEDFEATIAAFAQRMAAEPDNLQGWMLLARSYAQTGRLQQAIGAYEHLIARVKDDANLLADYADLLGAKQEGNLTGKPMEFIKRALKVDPNHWKALALAGTEAFDRNDFSSAEKYWTRARKSAPDNNEVIAMLEAGIKEAQAKKKK